MQFREDSYNMKMEYYDLNYNVDNDIFGRRHPGLTLPQSPRTNTEAESRDSCTAHQISGVAVYRDSLVYSLYQSCSGKLVARPKRMPLGKSAIFKGNLSQLEADLLAIPERFRNNEDTIVVFRETLAQRVCCQALN